MDPAVLRRAEALVRQYVVIDPHAHDPGKPASPAFPRQVTLPLMIQERLGGLVQIVPFSQVETDHPADTILADLRRVKADLEADGRVVLALRSDEFARSRRLGRPAVMLGVEYFRGLLDGRLETLDAYYEAGVRVVGFSHGGKDLVTEGEGGSRTLTSFGRKVIETMNALGIACDVTHVPDTIRRQVIEASRAPVLISHSAAVSVVASPFNVNSQRSPRSPPRAPALAAGGLCGGSQTDLAGGNRRRTPPRRADDDRSFPEPGRQNGHRHRDCRLRRPRRRPHLALGIVRSVPVRP